MIIKSMSRKNSSYSQLLRYMEGGRHDEKFTFSHNLFTQDNSDIIKEFKHNANFFKHKKNGVMMYHEILSITRNNQLSEEQQKTLLKEIAQKYISSRANNNLVYAVLHDDKDEQLHYHLMISSNEIRSEKKHRLSKYEFEHIKKELENYVLNVHPELNQEKIINSPAQEKLSNKGEELKRRTKKTPQRDSVKERLKTVFEKSYNKSLFFENMEKGNLEIYVRKKSIGVIDKETGRKHRLKTLGMQDEFEKISAIIEQSENPNDQKENRQPYKEKIRFSRGKEQEEEPPQENRKPYKEKVHFHREKEDANTENKGNEEPEYTTGYTEKSDEFTSDNHQNNGNANDGVDFSQSDRENEEKRKRREKVRQAREQAQTYDNKYSPDR